MFEHVIMLLTQYGFMGLIVDSGFFKILMAYLVIPSCLLL